MEKQGKAADPFVVEDLLDLSYEDDSFVGMDDEVGFNLVPVNSTAESTLTAVDGGSISSSSVCDVHLPAAAGFAGAALSDDIYVPQEEVAELEWLSNFVEESFSSEDLQKLQLIFEVKSSSSPSSSSATGGLSSQAVAFCPETHVPGKARSKRRRPAPSNTWSSRILVLTPAAASSELDDALPLAKPISDSTARKATKPAKKRGSSNGPEPAALKGRKCLHCATDTTPQWRAGPTGPKTLCNACGVRYKSGRLVPEYRPVASPTFVPSKHSNSHRKVLELRRQKELQQQQQQQRREEQHSSSPFEVPSGFLPDTSWVAEQF